MPDPILQVEDLGVQFRTDDGVVEAVRGVSFGLQAAETLGIVGESGSGKTVANLAILGLIPQPPGRITSGRILYRGRDLLKLTARELCDIRGHKIAMVFQDPMTALNPFLTVAEQLTEVTRQHLGFGERRALAHAVEMLERVGISAASERVHDYPHQFSGGMRQRVMIAMALSCKPDVLIADEPTTALDVTIQAQILELMRDLQRNDGTAILLITHDLGVVANACRRVLVMYAGRIVEEATADQLFTNPRHPYTRGLLRSVPRWDETAGGPLTAIDGQPPNLAQLPAGCSFCPRCEYRVARCEREEPPLVSSPSGGRFACFVNVDEAAPRPGKPAQREAAQ